MSISTRGKFVLLGQSGKGKREGEPPIGVDVCVLFFLMYKPVNLIIT